MKLKPGILFHLSRGVYCICVTGTNGKTTTCAMIEHGLKSNSIPCFINKSGANMLGGVTTAFIKNSNIFGKPKCRYAVLECDENSLPLITNCINSKIIVVTNIFRDQLDRYAEVNLTFEKSSREYLIHQTQPLCSMPIVRLLIRLNSIVKTKSKHSELTATVKTRWLPILRFVLVAVQSLNTKVLCMHNSVIFIAKIVSIKEYSWIVCNRCACSSFVS